MNINSAYANAISGIQRGTQGLERNAAQIASASTTQESDVTEPLVESRINKLQVEASARMARTVDETIGFLLDEMA